MTWFNSEKFHYFPLIYWSCILFFAWVKLKKKIQGLSSFIKISNSYNRKLRIFKKYEDYNNHILESFGWFFLPTRIIRYCFWHWYFPLSNFNFCCFGGNFGCCFLGFLWCLQLFIYQVLYLQFFFHAGWNFFKRSF